MEKWLDEGPHGCAIYQDYLDHLEEIQTTFQEKQASCRALIEEKTQLPLEYLDINSILAGLRAVENISVFLKKL